MVFLNQIKKQQADILRATLELADSIGVSGITVRNIARQIGLTEGALYRHFRSKTDIFHMVLDQIVHIMFEKLDEIDNQPTSIEEKLTAFARFALEFMADYPGVYRVFFSDELYIRNKPLYSLFRTCLLGLLSRIEQWIETARENGEFRPDTQSQTSALHYLGIIDIAFSAWDILDERTTPILLRGRALLDQFFEVLRRGGSA